MTEETFEDNIIEEDYDDDLDSEESEVHISTDEEVDHIADTAIAAIQDILKYFNVGEVTIDEYEGDEGELILDITGDDLAVLIGRHGKTLDALQFLISSITSRTVGYRYPIVIDVEGYKGRQRQKLEDIASLPFISLDENSSTRELYNSFFLEQGLSFAPDMETATTDQMLPLITHNLGIGFYPKKMAELALTKGDVYQIPLEEKLPLRRIYLVTNGSTAKSTAVRKMIKFIQEYHKI